MTWLVILTILFILSVLFIAIKRKREETDTEVLRDKLLQTAANRSTSPVFFDSLSALPVPVERYFRYVLPEGQHLITLATFKQAGKLKLSPEAKQWSRFKASLYVSEKAAAFLWDAKIQIFPFFYVTVRDSFLEGIGAGKATLMSVWTLEEEMDRDELNSGALYRYLAEAVWHPTALLPQSGIRWEAVDDIRAIAHLEKFGMAVSLEFRFNDIGEITGIYTQERFGRFGDTYVKYPWEGHFSDYREFNGIKIPTRGEVGWHLPDGWWLFWKGRIISAEFT